jgi:hypothetical protein
MRNYHGGNTHFGNPHVTFPILFTLFIFLGAAVVPGRSIFIALMEPNSNLLLRVSLRSYAFEILGAYFNRTTTAEIEVILVHDDHYQHFHGPQCESSRAHFWVYLIKGRQRSRFVRLFFTHP